jgi:hypothetical protein
LRTLLLFLLMTTTSFAQRMRGGGGQPPPQQAPATADEKARAQTAKEWSDFIEHARASVPQHPPDAVLKFPSKNTQFLDRLKYAENQKGELASYLEKLWSGAKDLESRRTALDALWTQATKPAWVRVAIDDYFKQKSSGAPLHAPAPSPAPATAAAPAATAKAEPAPVEMKK